MIRVAISGGGLAGASLMLGLLKYPQLDVHIFESAPEFREAGAAIVLLRNAIQALGLISPRAAQFVKSAGGVPQNKAHFMLAQGPDAGQRIGSFVADSKGATTTIAHRAILLRELLADVPPERMHTRKKLVSATQTIENGPVTLRFEDGSSHECDILVGADGIHSTVRKFILGKDDPATSPVPTGRWVMLALVPFDEVQEKLGDLVDRLDPCEYDWIGQGSYLIHHITGDGRSVQFAIGVKGDDADVGRWQKNVTANELDHIFREWPAHLRQAVTEILGGKWNQPAYFLWEHLPASTYVKGPVCILGDAAHASTPWQGSGGGISIEDSMMLSALLGEVQSVDAALTALQVYDQVRRPRTQRVVQSSNETGRLLTGGDPDVGLDLAKMKATLLRKWDFILNFDNAQHRDEAVEILSSIIINDR